MKIVFKRLLVFIFSSILISRAKASENVVSKWPIKKVAILPVSYINDASRAGMRDMQYHIQKEIFDILTSHNPEFEFQETAKTNALLRESKISNEDLRRYTGTELAEKLNVDFIIFAVVTRQKRGEKELHTYETGRGDSRRRRVFTTSDSYRNLVMITIHNEHGETVFSQSRRSLSNSVTAYNDALRHLLKRIPLFQNESSNR
jgi:hypothetical protein